MRHPYNIPDMMRLSTQMALMAVEAQMIMAMRLSGMAGLWNVTKDENRLMGTEKLVAMQAASVAAASAMVLGATPARVALAAVAPVRRKTRANARRLGKRGLKVSL